jgi:integrase
MTWLREYRRGNRNFAGDMSRFNTHVATAAFAKLPITEVDPPDLVEWLHVLRTKKVGHKPGQKARSSSTTLSWQTRKHALNLVRILFADAVQVGLCKTNPALGLHVKKTDADRGDQVPEDWPFKPHEIATMNAALGEDPERWLITFAIGTGLRQGEQANLHLVDVHLEAPEGPHVVVRYGGFTKRKLTTPKTRRSRKVPLFGVGLEALKRWLDILPTYAPHNPLGLVFPKPEMKSVEGKRGSKGGFRRQKGKMGRGWLTAKKALPAGRPAWWHLLRHTCATALLCGWWGRKWSLGEVGKLLGHSSVRTTEMYAHLLDSTLADLAAETDRAWSETLVKSSKNSGVPVVTSLSRPNGASTNSSMIS